MAKHQMIDVGRLRWLAGILFLGGALFLLYRSVVAPRPEVDFRFFWLAGRLWQMGYDPYSDAFRALGEATLPAGNEVLYWFYPPQWWIISRGLALFDLPTALAIWRLASSGIILLGSFWMALRLLPVAEWRSAAAAAIAGYAALIEPTANLLAFGQSSAPIFLAMAMIVVGYCRSSTMLVAIGMALFSLKPQVGAIVFLMLAMVPATRLAALIGVAIAAIGCLPQIASFGVVASIQEYLANLSQWGTLGSNTMLTSSGPFHLLARLMPGTIMPHLQFLVAIPLLGWCAIIMRERPDDRVPPMALFSSALVAVIPLHIYDMTMIVIPLILIASSRGQAMWPTLALISLLCIRPAKIESLFGVPTYGSGVSSGLITLTLASMALLSMAIYMNWQPPFSSGRRA